jgi:hypothetical protein
MFGSRDAIGDIAMAAGPAFNADLHDTIGSSCEALVSVNRSGVASMDSAEYHVLITALVASYPDWTDENGTNVEQLAAIALGALESAGMLGRDRVHHATS